MNIAIVVAEFNEKVTSRMHQIAIEKAKDLKLNIKYTCTVPGIFDMPLIIDKLLEKKDVDAVVTIGAVIKGQTKHDEIIAHSTARYIVKLSLKHKKPVSLGNQVPECQKDKHMQELEQSQKTQLMRYKRSVKN